MRGSKNPNPTALEKERRDQKLSRKKLAALSGVNERTIEKYEQRRVSIDTGRVEFVQALASALNVPIEKILEKKEGETK